MYTRDLAGRWNEVQKIRSDEPPAVSCCGTNFGHSLAVDADTLVVGDPSWTGAAVVGYVFNRHSDGQWIRQQSLTIADPDSQERTGFSAAIEGNTIVLGTDNGDLAVIFTRNDAGDWIQTQSISLSSSEESTEGRPSGVAVALDGGVMLLGDADDTGLGLRTGSVFVYQQGLTGIWTEVQKLAASDGMTGDRFGRSVALDGGRALILGGDRGYFFNVPAE